MDRLRGKVAIVTGASLGLGHAMALRMAEEGASVAILDVLDDAGREIREPNLSARDLPARYWHCDVTQGNRSRARGERGGRSISASSMCW